MKMINFWHVVSKFGVQHPSVEGLGTGDYWLVLRLGTSDFTIGHNLVRNNTLGSV